MPGCEGLGPVGDRLVLTRTVHALHAAALARLGPGESLELASDLAFSDAALELVLREGRAAGHDLRVVIESPVLAPIAALTGQEAAFVYRTGPARAEPPTRRIVVPHTELPGFAAPGGPLAVVDAWALPVAHWTQLLWANLLGLGPALWQALGAGPGGALRLLWGVMRAGSVSPDRVALRVNRLGAGCRVHPHATVEGSVIGEGAVIGAGAVVRGCMVGAGARVEDLALVEGSVIGAGACVQRMAMVKYCLVESSAFAAGIQQLSVLGAGATVKLGAVLHDQAFGQDVRVAVAGRGLTPAPRGLVGVCVGPGAVLGSGVRVAAGRVIPAGLTVVADPDAVLSRVDAPPGARIAAVSRGGLVAR